MPTVLILVVFVVVALVLVLLAVIVVAIRQEPRETNPNFSIASGGTPASDR